MQRRIESREDEERRFDWEGNDDDDVEDVKDKSKELVYRN